MPMWWTEYLGTVLVGTAVLAILAFALYRVIRARKKGGGCGCGCASCPMSSSCHARQTTRSGEGVSDSFCASPPHEHGERTSGADTSDADRRQTET